MRLERSQPALPLDTNIPASVGVGASNVPGSARDLDQLMNRYASGDKAAFPELYRQIAPRLRMFLLRLCGRPRLADDLLQDAFLRIHRARGSFSTGAAVLPWTYAIARNVYIDHARKGRDRNLSSIDDVAENAQPASPVATSPDAALTAKQTLEIVQATLAKLPVNHREAFILIRFEGLSISEAAQVLDTSEANVKVRAFRAYEAFRAALREGESNEP